MNHFEREQLLNKKSDGNYLSMDEEEPLFDHCHGCGGEIHNGYKYCDDCRYEIGRED